MLVVDVDVVDVSLYLCVLILLPLMTSVLSNHSQLIFFFFHFNELAVSLFMSVHF